MACIVSCLQLSCHIQHDSFADLCFTTYFVGCNKTIIHQNPTAINVLTRSDIEHCNSKGQNCNFWKTKEDSREGMLILDLGCAQEVNTIQLVNIHNGQNRDRSTKEFRVSFSSDKDDFKELFDSLAVKICWGSIMILELTFNNAFNFFFMMFDKYGEDSLKRSLNNQLISQVGYPVMLHNLIVVPSWTWRVFFGPLNTGWADTVVLIGNAITIWVSLCFTEALTIKAAMATR